MRLIRVSAFPLVDTLKIMGLNTQVAVTLSMDDFDRFVVSERIFLIYTEQRISEMVKRHFPKQDIRKTFGVSMNASSGVYL